MHHYIINTKETTRNLLFTEEVKCMEEKSVEELESFFGLNKTFTADDFTEFYEICEVDVFSGEVITLKHFDTGFKMKV